MIDNYFYILGISNDATLNEIKKAYRKKALLYHPDKNQSSHAHDEFAKINEAYHYLLAYKTNGILPENAHKIKREKTEYEKAKEAYEKRKKKYYQSTKDREYAKERRRKRKEATKKKQGLFFTLIFFVFIFTIIFSIVRLIQTGSYFIYTFIIVILIDAFFRLYEESKKF